MDALSTTAQDDSSGANPSSIKSEDSSPQRESGAGSPPPNCAICLGTCRNKSFTDSCLHQFCFSCLLTWSKVKAECPLCKQAFRSIIHNVQSNHQYEEYLVVQRQTEESTSRIDINRVTAATHRFRYRTTLTLPRRESVAIQQLLLRHYPASLMSADVLPPPARRRRSPAAFRRTVYRHNLWARPLPDFTGRFRDCSPEFYSYNNTQMHRLVPWLNRELHYLLNENIGHIAYVIARIMELLPQHPINSLEFREAVQRYFGDRTEHFLHELYCFASTPYDMAGYDRNVQYTTDTRISTMINEVISSSDSEASVDSDIVMVSSSEPAEQSAGPSRVPPPVYPQSYISQPPTNVIPIETIYHSDTDDDSSEVMVVGYIKPPQDRTPEIVDLLGSDSDVIVQDTQQEQADNSVKLTLKRHRTSYEEQSIENIKRRRRRCRRSDGSTTTDTTRSTPEPDPERRWMPLYLSSDTASEFSSSSDQPSHSSRRSSRNSSLRERRRRDKRSARKANRALARNRESRNAPEADHVRPSRKSHSGKGVKSSNRNGERSSAPATQAEPVHEGTPPLERPESAERGVHPVDQPGSSGGCHRRKTVKERNRRRRESRESRRLRSVVNVINSHRSTDESNSSANPSNYSNAATSSKCEEERRAVVSSSSSSAASHDVRRARVSSTDSEDNLPLNLTLHKMAPPSK